MKTPEQLRQLLSNAREEALQALKEKVAALTPVEGLKTHPLKDSVQLRYVEDNREDITGVFYDLSAVEILIDGDDESYSEMQYISTEQIIQIIEQL